MATAAAAAAASGSGGASPSPGPSAASPLGTPRHSTAAAGAAAIASPRHTRLGGGIATPDWDDARSEASGVSYGAHSSGAPSSAAAGNTTPVAAMPLAAVTADGGGAAAAAAVAEAPPLMRLGLHLERRADVRRLADGLVRAVQRAGDDLAAAVDEVRQLRANNGALAAQLAAAGGAGIDALRQQLEAVRCSCGFASRNLAVDMLLRPWRN